jgi:4-carboxymuconolactone decarboxylase
MTRSPAFLVILLLMSSTPLGAQDRLPAIPSDALTPDQKDAIAAFEAARKAPISGPFIPLLRSPDLMTRVRAVGDYARYASALPPRLSEFVILLTSRHWTQQYEWSTHYSFAMKAGVPAETVRAIADGRHPEQMSDEEAVLYDFCTELQHNQSVSDATYTRALAAFGEKGVVDTVGIVGYYTMLAMILNVSRTPVTDASTPLLQPFPR